MGELTKPTAAELLRSVLKPPEQALQKRPSQEVTTRLMTLLEALIRRYPGQENADAMPEYLADYEALAVRYSILAVEQAVAALRVDPEQQFFPKPNEVAAEMRRQRLKKLPSDVYARG